MSGKQVTGIAANG